MINHYYLRLTLNDAQSVIIDQLRSNGADLIQTNDGICLKSDKSIDALKKLLGDDFHGKIEPVSLKDSSEFPEDVKAFLNN